MSEATREAAAAVLAAAEQKQSLFPAVGVVRRMNVVTDDNGFVTAIDDLSVSIDGDTYLCGYGGGFAAEISTAGGLGAGFVGRKVRVEKFGRGLLVAYTVNGSDQ